MAEQVQPPPVEVDDAPPPHRPNPKVAVVVAGAALAVTTGLTLLVLPYVRQAAKMQERTEFLSHLNRARPIAAQALKAKQAAATPAPAAGAAATTQPLNAVSSAATSIPEIPKAETEPVSPILSKARAFNQREEDKLWGKTEFDEDGEPLEPVSPWLGFQALAIATAIVGGSAALGIYGAAKYLGVSSMKEFSDKMRGSLENSYPELIANVRREAGEADGPTPAPLDVMDRHGYDVDDEKLRAWVASFGHTPEGQEFEEAQEV